MIATALGDFAARWSSYYGNHQILSVTIRFLHLAGLVVGGGTALFVDRQVLRAARSASADRAAVLASVTSAHSSVIPALMLVGITGVLMTAADAETFVGSTVFWIKMILVALLSANGVALFIVERRASRFGVAAAWPRLATASALSAFLWLTVLFLGALLTVAA